MIRAIHFNDREAFLGQSLPGSTHFDLIGEPPVMIGGQP